MSTPATPTCWIIAGPNGAGKTTFALDSLPHAADCRIFVNADLIAAGMSPLAPERERVAASRIFLREIERHIAARHDFSFETTLSGRGYLRLIRRLKTSGSPVVGAGLKPAPTARSDGLFPQQRRTPRDSVHPSGRASLGATSRAAATTAGLESDMMQTPEYETQALEALTRAVARALERKRRLGQYAVVWREGEPVCIGPDAPMDDAQWHREPTLVSTESRR